MIQEILTVPTPILVVVGVILWSTCAGVTYRITRVMFPEFWREDNEEAEADVVRLFFFWPFLASIELLIVSFKIPLMIVKMLGGTDD